ncbi:MAG TPA: hypothetical protein VJ916_01935 [Anaerovoracaceae bacterium]|nr:hypothetical protein [Anaerovoracaceae bacterium]
MSIAKKIALSILAMVSALIIWLDIQPEWIRYVVIILFLVGIWIPDKNKSS